MRLPYRRTLYAIVGFGFLYKMLSLALISGNLPLYGMQRGDWDSPTYYNPAMTLARSFTFHSEVRTPGYPAFLALIYAFTRDPNPISDFNLSTIFIFQSALLSLGCLPIAAAIKRLTENERLALLGALVWAINNSARYYSIIVLTEALAASVMCLFAYTLVHALQEEKPVWIGLTGLLMFALTSVRPSASLMAIPVTAGYLIHVLFIRKDRSPKRAALIVLLLFFLPLSSQWLWSYRNYALEGKWYYCRLSAFGVYAFGVAIPVGVSEGKTPERAHAEAWYEFFRLLPNLTPQAMDRMYKIRVREAIRAHPMPIAKYFLKSCFYLFIPTINKPLDSAAKFRDLVKPGFYLHLSAGKRIEYLFYFMNSILEFALLMGTMILVLSRALPGRYPSNPTRKGLFVLILLLLLYWIPVHAIAAQYAFTRFLFPLMPVLLIGAAVALGERNEKDSHAPEFPSPKLPVSSPIVS